MQTFLPYADFRASAQALDRQRLGKQRVEALSIHRILMGQTAGGAWRNHPAVNMWRGYEDALCLYLEAMIEEWVKRGYKNNIIIPPHENNPKMPYWLGYSLFHQSHRSNLTRKLPEWYNQHWSESPEMEYVWPA